jgi:hypothetical protein
MELEMVLNELSFRSLAIDEHVARQRMSDLVLTAITATKYGVKRVIRTHNNLNAEILAPDYPIARWRNDNMVDLELRRFFRTLITKYPFLEDIADSSIQDNFGLSEFFHAEDRAIGLGVAYWLDALAISLRSDEAWCYNRLQLRIMQLDENEEFLECVREIPHASSVKHIQEHIIWIKERLRQDDSLLVRDGASIWEHKEEWFPNLFFSEKVGEQMQSLASGNLLLMPIMKRLHELEAFCNAWLAGPFDQNKMSSKVTNESESTLAMFTAERTFRCHDGMPRTFRWHLRLTPGSWRLYFYPLVEERKLIIGYIGPHLRTAHYAH